MTPSTTDPALRSWVASANIAGSAFPVQNLPFGVFSPARDAPGRIGVAIGDSVLDLHAAVLANGLELSVATGAACASPTLNALMTLDPEDWQALREALSLRFRDDASERVRALLRPCLHELREVSLHLPVAISDYTDFYASIHHATNVGRMFRPDNPLLPNYRYVPIGYHGRASSVVVSGTPVVRPRGQVKGDGDEGPRYQPTARLDYELEIGAWIGGENALGEPVPIEMASKRLFGLCLLNDWSARDVQAWESQPLGPFLSKSFATSISPWVVSMDALAPFRVAPAPRAETDPPLLPHLDGPDDRNAGAFDVSLEVHLQSARMRDAGTPSMLVSRSNLRDLYWTFAQLVTHHASNGCNLRPGDLIGSGTVSGPDPANRACLLERTWRGTEPLMLPSGEQRRFLEDGDEVILRGVASRDGAVSIGLGECRGIVVPGAQM